MAQIRQSVGQGGHNSKEDVETIQHLLNKVPPLSGGPDPKLDMDGISSGSNWYNTVESIHKFQKAKNVGPSDGRIDPGGKTFAELLKYERTFFPVEPGEISLPSVNDDDLSTKPHPLPKSKTFAIQMLGECSLGEEFMGQGACFKIWDTTNYIAGTFYYMGAGVGAGGGISGIGQTNQMSGLFKSFKANHSSISKIIGNIPGLTVPGPWNLLNMPIPADLWDFQGPANFTSAGGLDLSYNFLILYMIGQNKTLMMKIDTGITIGFGISSTAGAFAMEPLQEYSFHGN